MREKLATAAADPINGPSTAQAALAIIVMASLPGSIRQAHQVAAAPVCPTS